ncbi:MAG: hypothetical protein OWQ59_10315 [Alicyclobacillaceae bacterium]|uniref:hypothetical protein n=1 Tax=Alicyclobacillus sp. SP_1 TaxID=2942475 RepID=UPI002157B6AA|nr:hypothetical protein [Alicyclobacillus sp. SP_1]MCY0888837.1 hypothetical protein [Alicyclobacillaceae bacterium]
MKDSHRVPGEPLRRIDLAAIERQDHAKAHFFDVSGTEVTNKQGANGKKQPNGDSSSFSRQE